MGECLMVCSSQSTNRVKAMRGLRDRGGGLMRFHVRKSAICSVHPPHRVEGKAHTPTLIGIRCPQPPENGRNGSSCIAKVNPEIVVLAALRWRLHIRRHQLKRRAPAMQQRFRPLALLRIQDSGSFVCPANTVAGMAELLIRQ